MIRKTINKTAVFLCDVINNGHKFYIFEIWLDSSRAKIYFCTLRCSVEVHKLFCSISNLLYHIYRIEVAHGPKKKIRYIKKLQVDNNMDLSLRFLRGIEDSKVFWIIGQQRFWIVTSFKIHLWNYYFHINRK